MQEVGPPHGKAHTLNTLVLGLGVFHHGQGRVEASLFQQLPHLHQHQPDQQGVGVSFQTPTTPT